VEIKKQADGVVFTTDKLIKDTGEKMKPEDKKELEEKLEALRKVKDSDQHEEMKKKMEELNAVAQKIGASMYSAQGGQAGGPSTDAGQAGGQAGGEGSDKNPPAGGEGPVEGEVVK